MPAYQMPVSLANSKTDSFNFCYKRWISQASFHHLHDNLSIHIVILEYWKSSAINMALVLTDSHGKYFAQHFDGCQSGIVCHFESGIKIEEVFPSFGHLISGFKVCYNITLLVLYWGM